MSLKPIKSKYFLPVIFVIGFFLRIIAAFCYPGHATDMQCFDSWSEMVYEGGFSAFYTSDAFTDYPPGYMYILFILGYVKNLLGTSGILSYVLLKLPAIICDILMAYSVYKIPKSNKVKALSACLVLFNPVIILNSAVWGQVDSVYTLLVLWVMMLLSKKKNIPAYFVFAAAIFIKPQALFYAPVLLYGIIDNVFLSDFSKKKLIVNLIGGISAIASVFLLALPFGIENVINQYIDTIGSYSYASVNAYNLWSGLGLNWAELNPFMSAVAYFFIGLTVIASALIFFKKRTENKYFFTSAFICFSVFILSVKMHERYAYPAVMLMLCAAIISSKKEEFWLFAAISAVQLINTAHILFFYSNESFFSASFIGVTLAVSWVSVAALIIMWIYSKKEYIGRLESVPPEPTKSLKKLTPSDVKAITIITAVYSLVALFWLGSTSAPQTYELLEKDVPCTIDFGEDTDIDSFYYYLGPVNISADNTLSLSVIDEGGSAVYSAVITEGNVFSWNKLDDISTRGRYIELTSSQDLYIFEIMTWAVPKTPSKMFDEQDLFPSYPYESFLNGTYFDEIYHARTAYEYIHALPVYEWTHPPLGKIFISMGINIFGMTPFGWRIIGTLFGILMLPLIYIFAKKLTGISWITICATLLLAFDFMHFTQSRIATIDVYVTFFIMLMYLFMYRYYTMSFYDVPLSKTLAPLGFCGIFMGLGIASKWTGVYAGAGLAVIFFITLFNRYREHSPLFWRKTVKTGLFCILAFIAVPVIIYILSYIPYLKANNEGFWGIIQNQIDMFTYHGKTVVESEHPFSSPWYQWILNIRPIWYYSGYDVAKSMNISAFGNPIVWLGGLLAFFYCIYDAVRFKDKNSLFLVIAYLAQLLPWIPVTRTTFIYHYFPCVPFLVLMSAYTAKKIYNKNKRTKKYFIAITVLAVLLFIMFYPVISGYPTDDYYVKAFLRWLPTWQLIG